MFSSLRFGLEPIAHDACTFNCIHHILLTWYCKSKGINWIKQCPSQWTASSCSTCSSSSSSFSSSFPSVGSHSASAPLSSER